MVNKTAAPAMGDGQGRLSGAVPGGSHSTERAHAYPDDDDSHRTVATPPDGPVGGGARARVLPPHFTGDPRPQAGGSDGTQPDEAVRVGGRHPSSNASSAPSRGVEASGGSPESPHSPGAAALVWEAFGVDEHETSWTERIG